jgi:hypothetical protein
MHISIQDKPDGRTAKWRSKQPTSQGLKEEVEFHLPNLWPADQKPLFLNLLFKDGLTLQAIEGCSLYAVQQKHDTASFYWNVTIQVVPHYMESKLKAEPWIKMQNNPQNWADTVSFTTNSTTGTSDNSLYGHTVTYDEYTYKEVNHSDWFAGGEKIANPNVAEFVLNPGSLVQQAYQDQKTEEGLKSLEGLLVHMDEAKEQKAKDNNKKNWKLAWWK